MALILEEIWDLRNFFAHQKEEINIQVIINNKARECILAIDLAQSQAPYTRKEIQWKLPLIEVAKLNVDTTIMDKFTTLAIAIWDEKCEVIFAWARQHVPFNPVHAEATTMLWALQLSWGVSQGHHWKRC